MAKMCQKHEQKMARKKNIRGGIVWGNSWRKKGKEIIIRARKNIGNISSISTPKWSVSSSKRSCGKKGEMG